MVWYIETNKRNEAKRSSIPIPLHFFLRKLQRSIQLYRVLWEFLHEEWRGMGIEDLFASYYLQWEPGNSIDEMYSLTKFWAQTIWTCLTLHRDVSSAFLLFNSWVEIFTLHPNSQIISIDGSYFRNSSSMSWGVAFWTCKFSLVCNRRLCERVRCGVCRASCIFQCLHFIKNSNGSHPPLLLLLNNYNIVYTVKSKSCDPVSWELHDLFKSVIT